MDSTVCCTVKAGCWNRKAGLDELSTITCNTCSTSIYTVVPVLPITLEKTSREVMYHTICVNY